MTSKVIMPQLGESVVEGTVSRWLKNKGDRIQQYEPLVEVSTDKVDTEIPSPASGVLLDILVAEGETVRAGALLALIGEPEEAGSTGSRSSGNGKDHDEMRAAYTGHVTPVVARMVAEHDLDLSAIRGTGRGGRITKKDVEAYLAGAESRPETEVPAWEQPGEGDLFKPTEEYLPKPAEKPAAARPTEPAARKPERVHPVEPVPEGTPGERVQLTAMRRSIAEHMVRSKLQTAPHVTTVFEADMSAVMKHREAHRAEFASKGVNLTLTAYFVAASVTALQAHPAINAEWRDDSIFRHNVQHIGVAVALDEGLIVPVIRNAQDLNLLGIARAVNDLAARARSQQLKPDEIRGGTFTISNHGVSGSLFATPIIHQPQAAILGAGIVEKRVTVIDDAIAIRPMCYLSLTFDHRIVDGAEADGFMMTLKRALEGWR